MTYDEQREQMKEDARREAREERKYEQLWCEMECDAEELGIIHPLLKKYSLENVSGIAEVLGKKS